MLILSKIYNFLLSIFIIYLLLLLPSDLLWDRENYLNYAENSDLILSSYDSFFQLMFNDYFFLKINHFMSYFFTPINVINFFLVSSLSLYFYLISKYSINSLCFTIGIFLSILIVPILHLEVVAIRQFMATIVALFALSFFNNRNKILILLIISALIHSSFFVFLVLFIFDSFIADKFHKNKRFILNLLFIVFLASTYIIIGQILGVRQVELYSSYTGDVGGGSFFIAFVMFIYLFFYYGSVNNKYLYAFVLNGIVLFMVFYFTANVSVSARFLSSVFPAFILLLVSKFRRVDVFICLLLILAYGFVWFKGGQYMIFEVSKYQIEQYFLEKL